jgi:hypothetical protein
VKPGGQCDRMYRFIKANPGVSSLEITQVLSIVNVTGRISDLRAEGIDVAVDRDRDGTVRYRIREAGQIELGLSA